MKLYRIITEDKNANAIEGLVASYFDGFSILQQTGYWKGEREASLVIEIMTETGEYWKVKQIARQIKLCNAQQAVLVQELNVEGEFV